MIYRKKILWLCIISFCLLICFFSWVPNPSFRNLLFLPEWLIEWTDQHGILRTSVPFIPLSFICFSFIEKKEEIKISLLLFFLAFFVEVIQLFIPQRVFDWLDILLAVIGILVGWTISKILLLVLKRLNLI